MTTQLYETLENILRQQLEVYRTFLDLAREKKDVLVNGDVPALEKIINQEQKLLMIAGKLEQRRLDLHGQLSKALGIAPVELTLAKLAAIAGQPFGDRYTELAAALQETLTRLDEANQLNTRLAQQALNIVNFSLNLLSGATGKQVTYAPTGEVEIGSANSRAGILDTKA